MTEIKHKYHDGGMRQLRIAARDRGDEGFLTNYGEFWQDPSYLCYQTALSVMESPWGDGDPAVFKSIHDEFRQAAESRGYNGRFSKSIDRQVARIVKEVYTKHGFRRYRVTDTTTADLDGLPRFCIVEVRNPYHFAAVIDGIVHDDHPSIWDTNWRGEDIVAVWVRS